MNYNTTIICEVNLQRLIKIKANSAMDAEFKYLKFLNSKTPFSNAENEGFKFIAEWNISPSYRFDLTPTGDGFVAGVVQVHIWMKKTEQATCSSEDDAWEKADTEINRLRETDPFYDWEWKGWIAEEETSHYRMKEFFTSHKAAA